ncbi:MAG: DUF6909 family protein [Spirochaetota bacterium]
MSGNDRRSITKVLDQVIPFRFLTQNEKEELVPYISRREYEPNVQIIEQGDTSDDSVFIVAEGTVETREHRDGTERRVGTIEAGHYFGEREALFLEPRRLEVRALGRVVCYVVPGEQFLELLGRSRSFAQALGTILRDKQGIFEAFDRFKVELVRAVNQGYVSMDRLLPYYMELDPALHPLVRSENEIDFGGLSYAVRRLPENVTHTFALLLIDEIPESYRNPDRFFPMVRTPARRREVWEMLPGKVMVLLRNGSSDLMDLITNLCLYSVEARKLRGRIKTPATLSLIRDYLEHPENHSTESQDTLFARLGFTETEVAGLRGVWPTGTVQTLYEIACHREMFSIDVRRQRNNYNSRNLELWTDQVGNATEELLGYQPAALPREVRVHIISSNTHSVTNCLNPWFTEHMDEVEEWARRTEHPYMELEWENPYDRLYALARDYFTAFPEAAEESRAAERRCGVLRLEETASTGVQAQLIDVSRLHEHQLDPGITLPQTGSKDLIVNIDYAFGEQARHIIKNLLMLFGHNLAGLNFLGKAGALAGSRGDVLAPNAFVGQSTDTFQPLPPPDPAACARLAKRIPGHDVHTGPLLTVDGTLLQNRMMLRFYRRIWGCLGIEMEGIHYYLQVVEAAQLGVIPEETQTRLFYYVSDLPLEHTASLSAPLGATEGVPPLYAITRHILSESLSS